MVMTEQEREDLNTMLEIIKIHSQEIGKLQQQVKRLDALHPR